VRNDVQVGMEQLQWQEKQLTDRSANM